MSLSVAAIALAGVACVLAGASLYLDLHTRHHSRAAHRKTHEVHALVQEVHEHLTGHEGDCNGPVYYNPRYLRDPYDDYYPPIARGDDPTLYGPEGD